MPFLATRSSPRSRGCSARTAGAVAAPGWWIRSRSGSCRRAVDHRPDPRCLSWPRDHRRGVGGARRGRRGRSLHLAGGSDLDLDLAAEQLIIGRIRDAFPGHEIIAEESGVLGADGGGGRCTWLVDPISIWILPPSS